MIFKTKKKRLWELTFDARALAIYMLQSEQYRKDIELKRLVNNVLGETEQE